ncbi:MAG TPA: YceI family protein [Candidatus Paceibacterota bacterium]|nr:YceI family protein [Verrucomicrobiota bacterium]HSA10128.1 YceI family protein [Candidatus Paceibacterota bacterium]
MNTKRHTLFAGTITCLLLAAASLQAASQMTTYAARSGSKMRIEGTSNIHDWQVESPFIGGLMEVGPGFPLEPGQAVTPGKVEAKAEVFIQVRSLKSIEKDGKPYSDKMDEIMWEHLKEPVHKRIVYHLTEMTLKEAPKAKDAPYVFDAKGDLAVAGVTNKIAMVVNVLPLADKKLEITGTVALKMTDFKVNPPAPKIALGLIKTGDDVKLIFKWIVGQRKLPAA